MSDHKGNYFSNTDHRLRQISDEEHKAAFICDELSKWELAEIRLAKWAALDDGSPNPFSPPIDAKKVSRIIRGLNDRLYHVANKLACIRTRRLAGPMRSLERAERTAAFLFDGNRCDLSPTQLHRVSSRTSSTRADRLASRQVVDALTISARSQEQRGRAQ